MSKTISAYKLLIRGPRVQGVGYRGWLVSCATRAGLCGWTRNRSDGSVESWVQGAGEAIEDVIQACRQGPTLAIVADVEREPAIPQESCEGFDIRETV